MKKAGPVRGPAFFILPGSGWKTRYGIYGTGEAKSGPLTDVTSVVYPKYIQQLAAGSMAIRPGQRKVGSGTANHGVRIDSAYVEMVTVSVLSVAYLMLLTEPTLERVIVRSECSHCDDDSLPALHAQTADET